MRNVLAVAFRLAVIAAALLAAWASAFELYSRGVQGPVYLHGSVSERAGELARAERLDEAGLAAHYVLQNPASGSVGEATGLLASIHRQNYSMARIVRQFARGAATGMPDDAASLAGAVSLDLFVVGDVRDLVVQGYRELDSGGGDSVIMALSAVGLVTTLRPGFDWVPAMLKAFRKAGAFSGRFLGRLNDLASRSVKRGDFTSLGKVADDFGTLVTSLGPGASARVMKYVDSPAELSKVAAAGRRNGAKTFVVVDQTGRRGVRKIVTRGSGVLPVKVASRGAKLAHKAFGTIPDQWLVLMFLIATIVVAWTAVRLFGPRRSSLR